MPPARLSSEVADSDQMHRSYIRVIIVWVLVLAGLYALQEYFS